MTSMLTTRPPRATHYKLTLLTMTGYMYHSRMPNCCFRHIYYCEIMLKAILVSVLTEMHPVSVSDTYCLLSFSVACFGVNPAFNLYRPNGTTSVPANVLLFGRAVQRLYHCVIPLLKAPSKHKFKTIVLFECLEFFYCFTKHFHESLVHMS
jgi:hypothetical protein